MDVDNSPKILMAGWCLNGRWKLCFHFSWHAFLIVLAWAPPRSCFSLSTNKHILWLFARFRTLETFQSTWHPFKLAARKPSTNRMGFREALSIRAQSVCSPRHSLSWLIYFILKGLSICITRTGWKKYWVMSLTFFCLFKIILSPSFFPLSCSLLPTPTFIFLYRCGVSVVYLMHLN